MRLTKKASIWLPQLARRSIEYFLETKNFLDVEKLKVDPAIKNEVELALGAFVVLEILRSGKKKAIVRGQSGTFEAVERLDKLVSQLAVNAAFFDTSTPRLKAYELNDLKIHVYLPGKLNEEVEEAHVSQKLQKNKKVGVMLAVRGRMATDLPTLRDLEESSTHRLRRLRLQLGVSRKNSAREIEYYTFTGQEIHENVS